MAVTGEMRGCRVADAWHLDRIRVALPAAGSSRLSNPAAAAAPAGQPAAICDINNKPAAESTDHSSRKAGASKAQAAANRTTRD